MVRLIHYQQILNISSYTITWLVKIQINHYYFTMVLYEVVVVFNIITWVLWSLSQRIPSKSCQTNPLLPEREVHTPLEAERNSNEENWWWLPFGTWETYVLLKDVHSFFLLSDFFDWQESLWGLSQNLRLTCYLLWVFEEMLQNHTGSSTCYDCYY